MSSGSLLATFRACAVTVRVCAPTAAEALVRTIPRATCDARLAYWARRTLEVAGAETFVEGLEHVRRDETYVVISNHQSSYDVMLLLHAFPGTLRMVSKKEMFEVPFVGRAMAAAEFVSLDRSDRRRARDGLRDAARRIASGVNVWIAPEGTRSPDGELLPFKRGGFMLAFEAGVRILPTTVIGSRKILPSKGVRVHMGQRAGVRFHPPVDPAAFGHERRAELVEEVRRAIASGLEPAPAGSSAVALGA
jgi:1-acyl-sn-glycerol-3-phosphate acyltransferase